MLRVSRVSVHPRDAVRLRHLYRLVVLAMLLLRMVELLLLTKAAVGLLLLLLERLLVVLLRLQAVVLVMRLVAGLLLLRVLLLLLLLLLMLLLLLAWKAASARRHRAPICHGGSDGDSIKPRKGIRRARARRVGDGSVVGARPVSRRRRHVMARARIVVVFGLSLSGVEFLDVICRRPFTARGGVCVASEKKRTRIPVTVSFLSRLSLGFPLLIGGWLVKIY